MSGPLLIDAHHLGLGQTGNETWSRNVVEALEADGESDFDVAVTAQGRSFLPTSVANSRVVEVSSSSSRRLLIDLPRALRARAPAALLVHYTLPPVPRVPGIVLVHDLSFESPFAAEWLPRASLLRYRATVRASVRRAGHVLAPTQWTAEDILRTYGIPRERVSVAGNALDSELGSLLARARPAPGDYPVVLAVGTVLPRKNLLLAARAVAALRAAGSPVRLRLVGPLPSNGRAELMRIRATLPEGLDVVGAVSQAELAEEYLRATVLAYPSKYEGFGIPLLEAMRARTPVVCSNATCLPEVAGGAALLADPEDLPAWIAALDRALTDAVTRQELVARGTQRFAAYSWDATAAAVRRAVRDVSS